MFNVYPKKPRSKVMRYLLWLPIVIEILIVHPKNGLRYAIHWANRSLKDS